MYEKDKASVRKGWNTLPRVPDLSKQIMCNLNARNVWTTGKKVDEVAD
jgi:hypothetical protein